MKIAPVNTFVMSQMSSTIIYDFIDTPLFKVYAKQISFIKRVNGLSILYPKNIILTEMPMYQVHIFRS